MNLAQREMNHIFSRVDVDQRPVAIFRTDPDVTDREVQAMKSLRALFLMVAEPDGSVSNIQLVSTSGSPEVDQACIAALGQWKFKPAVRKGKIVRCWVQQSLLFKVMGHSIFESH
jgi:TonB family protein